MVLNEDEKKALNKKYFFPKETVFCPRCGNEIILMQYGNSYEMKCKTKGCIAASVRGI